MPHNRFFLESILQVGDQTPICGEEAHHLLHVMRKKRGEQIELINGKNQLARAEIVACSKHEIAVEILTVEEKKPPPFATILCQALPRFNRLETIVEKGTELGMSELWLFPSQLSEKKELSAQHMKRIHAILIAALKQSGRLDLPKVVLNPPLTQWQLPLLPSFFGDLSSRAPHLVHARGTSTDLLFFNGPEAGFTSEEEHYFKNLHVQGVSLHKNILRVDTAAIVALTLLSLH